MSKKNNKGTHRRQVAEAIRKEKEAADKKAAKKTRKAEQSEKKNLDTVMEVGGASRRDPT